MKLLRGLKFVIQFLFWAYLAVVIAPINWGRKQSRRWLLGVSIIASIGLLILPFGWLTSQMIPSVPLVTQANPPMRVVEVVTTNPIPPDSVIQTITPLTATDERIAGVISSVVNADTLDVTLATGEFIRVRLVGMDSPEPGMCFGDEAASYVSSHFTGAKVVVEGDPTQPSRDKFGRYLRIIRFENGETLNGLLIKLGYGFEYTYFTAHSYQSEWKSLEEQARAAGLGVWSPTGCNGQSKRPDHELQAINWVMPVDVVAAPVTKIRDGDTIEVELNGTVEPVRFIGIDTPETGNCYADIATQRVYQLVEGQTIYLESDDKVGDRDKYNRLLRYIWLGDGRMLNALQVAEGNAHEYTYRTVYRYQIQFMELEHLAQLGNLGLWSKSTCNGGNRRYSSANQEN